MKKKCTVKEKKGRWTIALIVLIVLILFSMFISGLISLFVPGNIQSGNVAIIEINGAITPEKSTLTSKTANPDSISELLDKAQKAQNIKAVILSINSPGGTPVASSEIASAIKKLNKTTVAVIRDVGASGAYWIATASDYILANEMSVTGSIGVYSSYLELDELFNKFGIEYRRLVAGEYKDTAVPYRNLTKIEEKIMQDKIDMIHDIFIEAVAENREMEIEKVREFATGMFYLGKEAKDYGLIDEIGGIGEAKAYLKDKLNITVETVEYQQKASLLDIFSGVSKDSSYNIGRGIGDSIIEDDSSIRI